ncbi:MAG: glycoside hydrolase family 3 C-terminal domain-containing protein [Chloroflexota bacterium]|nr:glycoside hydrolase family 3 C-terminal domain-containing protein [Chloroflexota bacterium]
MENEKHQKEIENFLSQMTLSEKVSLLSGRDGWYTVAIERLGIPAVVMTDGPHGVRTGGHGSDRIVSTATAYPTGISMASSWNRDLIQQVGAALAEETRHLGCHILLGPCVNIVRSPLGGRNFETFSEDPYLAGQIGVAYVNGVQSQGIGVSVKHFAANNQEFERFRGNSVVDERTLREIYLAAFETIVKETHPWTVMCSYNRINGTYASEHEVLLRRILKEEWGFEGVVVSDWGAVHDIHTPITAGLDLEMPGPARYFGLQLEAAVSNWQVDEQHVDDAARRMLRLLFWAGVMQDEDLPEGRGDTLEHRAIARELAAESIVLLKNDSARLPLKVEEIDKIAVIGLNADRMISGGGSSRVDPHHWVTPLEGLQAKLGNRVEISFEPGYENRVQPVPVEQARFLHPDGKTQGLKADFYNNLDFSGEPVLTRIDSSINVWWGGAGPASGIVDEKDYSVRWTGMLTVPESGETEFILINTGSAKVWLDGELILDNDIGVRSNTAFDSENMRDHKAITMEKGQEYAFRAEFVSGVNNPFALIQFLYKSLIGGEGDLVERAVRLAKGSDAAIIVAGLPDLYESEGQDRPDMALPGGQEGLIRAVTAVNPNTVVVVNAGAPVAMPWANDVDALFLVYYPGQEGGHALADILFGDVNPSGKLTVSFPERLEDNPAFVHYPGWKDVHYGEGLFVGYRYYDTKDVAPLFPFGHGLSYTKFTYSEMTLPSEVKMGETFNVSVTVENCGEMAGQEVIQVYIRDIKSALVRPMKELKGFEKVYLEPGESKIVTFDLDPRSLSYYDPYQKRWVAEEGEFEVLVGSSSRDIRLKGILELVDQG